MSIFITGGSGFVGLNLAALLLARGERVTLFSASAPVAGAVEELSGLPGELRVVAGDVTDAGALLSALRESVSTRVIHAAAITAGPERDAREPQRVVDVNLRGTLNMLEAARAQGVTRYVQASTGAVYGAASFAAEPIGEDSHLPSPSTMYGISKYAAERAVLHLGELWGMDVVAGRLAVVFGPWEYQTGLRDRMSALWQLTRVARDGGEAVVPAAGVQDWIYAPDVARSLVALLDAPRLPHRLYHLGAERPWGLAAWAAKLAGRYPAFRYRTSEVDAECTVAARGPVGRTPFNAGRLRNDLGFAPQFDLDSGFAHYMDWLDAHPHVWRDVPLLS
jgi:nucleoside-diphosphate-sugar epimerase